MKKLLPCLVALLSFSVLSTAQICTPDGAYADSTGVFPMPYHADLNPGGGINECAVVGQPYEFVFTVGVGDSISLTIAGNEIRYPLDKVVVTDVLGLPAGIAYDCAPSGCEFPKNTLGCAKLYGTTNAAPGDYNLQIKATVFFPIFPGQYNVTFPDPTIAPGEYKLQVLPNAGTACTAVGTREILSDKIKIVASPNPTSGPLQLEVDAEIAGDFQFKVLDLLGKTVHQEPVAIFNGKNHLLFDGSHLSNGIYLAFLQSEAGIISQKFTIQH